MDADRRPLSARAWDVATYGVPLAFLGLFFCYPLVAIVERGLVSGGDRGALDVLTDPLTREVVWFTLWQAAVSTLLTFAVALPATYVVARYAFPGRRLVRALVVVPFVLPTVVVALAFLAVLPERFERGWLPILVAHAFFNVAVVLLVVGTFWAGIDRRMSEAAATLGASPLQRLREVTLPALAPALASAASIVFLFSLTSFGVVLVLGGPQYATLEAEIYNQAVRAFDLRAAAVLALVQLAFVAVSVWAALRLEARLGTTGERRPEQDVLRRPATAREKALVTVSVTTLAIFLGAPLAVLVERSLSVGEGYGLDAYRALGRPTSALLATPWEAIANSIVYAVVATVIATLVGGLAAFAIARSRGPRVLDALLMLPLGASAVMLGFGFVIAFDTAPLDFRASPWLVPVAQALVAIPFVVRIVAPTLRSIDDRQREAAAVLGASPGRVRREIDLPIVGRALAVAAGFAFAISLGEFGATVFLARPDRPTLPVAIFRFLGRPGEINAAQAYALAVVLMAVTAAAILLVDRFRVRRGGWF